MRLVLCLALSGLPFILLGQESGLKDSAFTRQIAELGNEDFRVRERAHQQLRDAGAAAQAALELAAEGSPDAEVRQRAEVLLRRVTAGPRIKAAIAQLESAIWEEVKTGLFTLCDEMGEGTGAEEAVRKTSEGKGQSAQIARSLRQQWENWERQQQQFVRSMSYQNPQFMQQYFTNFRQNMKRTIEFMSKREFDQLHANKKKDKKGDPNNQDNEDTGEQ